MTLPALRSCIPYLLLAVVLILAALLPEHWQALLRYSRSGVSSAEYWRLFSGHLLHSNYWHLLMNLGGLVLAMLLHAGCFNYRQLALQWLLSALAISVLLYIFASDIQIYVGLSGLLHAMLTFGAIKDIQLKITTGWLLLAGLITKVAWEQWQGPDAELAELINASVATDAHLFGVLTAVVLSLAGAVLQAVKTAPAR